MSKASTLDILAKASNAPFVIDPFLVFSVEEWRYGRKSVLEGIRNSNFGQFVIVRSSTVDEDSPALPPGLFRSRLGVNRQNEIECANAIDEVIESYSKGSHSEATFQDEVIVQKQCVDVIMSGVARMSYSVGYCRVDYDDRSGKTDTITSGQECKSIELLLADDCALPDPWGSVAKMVSYVQRLLGFAGIILEFAIDATATLHLFQARRVPEAKDFPVTNASLAEIHAARAKLATGDLPLSDMTDWNPAELLGDRPKPLSYSLFRSIVSDQAWFDGRRSVGYRDIVLPQLATLVSGKPYIRIEKSFLSLTPASLPDELAQKLVRDRMDALKQQPYLHDKVEHFLLFTIADVVQPTRTSVLRSRGFSQCEVTALEESLRNLTNHILLNAPAWFTADRLAASAIRKPLQTSMKSVLETARAILEETSMCRESGVVPFARQARLAFVARDILNRLREGSFVDSEWEVSWWSHIHTVLDDILDGLHDLAQGNLKRSEFNERYGHLRASTFDICSGRYDQMKELPSPEVRQARIEDVLSDKRIEEGLSRAFASSGLRFGARQFLEFASQATELRELIKFEFTWLLSAVLERIAFLGEQLDFTREEMAYITFEDIVGIAKSLEDTVHIRTRWRDLIDARRDRWINEASLRLPELIFSADDLVAVPILRSKPTFITKHKVVSPVVVVTHNSLAHAPDLDGKLVIAESADPGFDWIFACRISGLITKFGGANSHMAIRCSQLQLPAAIGCGASMYERLLASTYACLDCGNQVIETGITMTIEEPIRHELK